MRRKRPWKGLQRVNARPNNRPGHHGEPRDDTQHYVDPATRARSEHAVSSETFMGARRCRGLPCTRRRPQR
jgi:hypothetical protein